MITARTIPFATKVKRMAANSWTPVFQITITRYNGMIHDFVLLNAIRGLPEVETALRQASDGIHGALKPSDEVRTALK